MCGPKGGLTLNERIKGRLWILALAAILCLLLWAPVLAGADEASPRLDPTIQDSETGAVMPDDPAFLSGPAPQPEESEPLTLLIWLDEPTDGTWGLTGILFGIPPDAAGLFLEYSYDGERFERYAGKTWEPGSWVAEDGFLPCQLLVAAEDPPLMDFLSGKQALLYIRMCAVRSDGTRQCTQAEPLTLNPEEDGPLPEPEFELVEDGGAPGLYVSLDRVPENTLSVWVEYSFGGETYYPLEGGAWELDASSDFGAPLRRMCIPIDAHPLTAYRSGAVNSLFVRLVITRLDADDLYLDPVVVTHGNASPLPQTPPPFTAEVRYSHGGYQVDGTFTDFPPDVVRVRPEYSLDGQTYRTADAEYPNDWYLANLGTTDERLRNDLENQCCITYDEEPLKSYVSNRIGRFFLRLEINTESGVYVSQAAVIERQDAGQVPDNLTVKAAFPFTMRPLDENRNPLNVPYGQYRVTVRENATMREVAALLPKTLPVEVQFFSGDGEQLAAGVVKVPAQWKPLSLPGLTAGQLLAIPDAAGQLTVPAGAQVATPLGNYLLAEPLAFPEGAVRLLLDVIGADEKPAVSLQVNGYDNALEEIGALSLAFRQKPSGATAIKVYSLLDGDREWNLLGDLLDRRDTDHNQSEGLYGYVTVLQPWESPFADYLGGDIPGFCIGLAIEGGAFDGERVTLPWPGEYDPPPYIPEPGGSEGNENNAGADGGSESGSNEAGQRPNLPLEPELRSAPPDLPQTPVETVAPAVQETLRPPAKEERRSARVPMNSGRETALDSSRPAQNENDLSDDRETASLEPAFRPQAGLQKSGVYAKAATAALVFAGGGIAIAAGAAASAGGAGGKGFHRLLAALRNLLTRL